MPAKKSTRATRTKAETVQAFENVAEAVASREPVPESEIALRMAKEQTLRSVADQFSLETAVQVLSGAGVGMSRALAELTKKLQDTARQVEELKEVKDLLVKDIEDLHGKEIAASAVEDLVADFKEKEETLRREFEQIEADIEFERKQAQSAWLREQQEHQRQQAEESARILADRKREEEGYQFSKTQERARADLAYANATSDKARENALRQADLERGWTQRETELRAKEQEFATLKTRVESIQSEIDAAVKKEVAIVTNSLSRDHKHATEILTKDFQAKETVANAKISSLTEQLAVANGVIANLNAQLSKAQEKVAEIAGNALTAASGSQTLREMQNFVTAQSSSNSQKKA